MLNHHDISTVKAPGRGLGGLIKASRSIPRGGKANHDDKGHFVIASFIWASPASVLGNSVLFPASVDEDQRRRCTQQACRRHSSTVAIDTSSFHFPLSAMRCKYEKGISQQQLPPECPEKASSGWCFVCRARRRRRRRRTSCYPSNSGKGCNKVFGSVEKGIGQNGGCHRAHEGVQ